MSRRILSLLFIATITVAVNAQIAEVRLSTEGAPALRVLSVQATVDQQKSRATVSIEVENTSAKSIKAFSCIYRTNHFIRGYGVWFSAEFPEAAIVLAPNERKRVVLLDNVTLPTSILSFPPGMISIKRVDFDDGTSWKLEDKKDQGTAPQIQNRER